MTLNGINITATRSDLLDRSILFELERIIPEKRLEEGAFWEEFEKDRPYIVGGMLDALSGAMKVYPTVKLSNLPRMADFCKWGYAVGEALEEGGGKKFLKAYYQNIGRAVQEAITAHPVANAIVALMRERYYWEGPVTNLLMTLSNIAGKEKIDMKARNWPKSENSLSRRLNNIKSDLMEIGIKVELTRDADNKSYATIKKSRKNTSDTSGAPESLINQAIRTRRY